MQQLSVSQVKQFQEIQKEMWLSIDGNLISQQKFIIDSHGPLKQNNHLTSHFLSQYLHNLIR